jgi:hypothetical protein
VVGFGVGAYVFFEEFTCVADRCQQENAWDQAKKA